MSVDEKHFAVPADKVHLVQQLHDDIKTMVEENNAIVSKAQADVASLKKRMLDLRVKSAKEICEACGVPYDASHVHMVETAYLSLGVAFLTILSGVVDDEEEQPARAGDLLRAPLPKNKLN